MSLMSQVFRGKYAAPRRAMLYGTHGIGKSTFGALAPAPIFIPTEEGLAQVDCAKFPLMRSYAEVMDALQELLSQPHDFRTVVIDSLDWLERMIFEDVCCAENVPNIERIGYQKGYTYALVQWRQLLAMLDELRFRRGMTVLLIAHAKVEKFQTPEDTAFDRFSPRLHKLSSALIQEWADEVFFAAYSAATDPKKIRGATAPERIMRTIEGPTHVAKNRLGMPMELPLLWSEYQRYIDAAIEEARMPAIVVEATVVTDAGVTAEQPAVPVGDGAAGG